ncbi:MAG TPA: hypothetical protein VFU49_10265 [Ktedonobacteraceae bacterium]|nr:hypothetical protein [Ktedonobacteraceae bacterium]
MAKQRMVHVQRRSYIFLLVSTLIVLLGGSLAVAWLVGQHDSSRADGSNVVGSPSLPAATVNTILARAGSPMAGTGAVIEQAARKTNIDDAFALAVWWTETNDGAAGVGRADRNPGGVRASPAYPAAGDGYTVYPSYAAGISDWFNIVKGRYISRGLTTVYAICYPYVGTSSAASWANKVVNLMLRYRGEAPPPTPTPTPRPTPHSHVQVQPEVSFPTNQHSQSQTSPKKQAAPAPQSPSLFARIGQTMLVMLGLLMALLLFLWGRRIKQTGGLPGIPTLLNFSRPTANSASPALKSTAPLSGGMARQFEPMQPYPSSLLASFPPVTPLPQQSSSLGTVTQVQPVVPVPVAGQAPRIGLSLPAHTTETRLRRVTLLGRNGPTSRTPMTNAADNEHATTEALPARELQAAPEPVAPAAPGARKGSLWQYGES